MERRTAPFGARERASAAVEPARTHFLLGPQSSEVPSLDLTWLRTCVRALSASLRSLRRACSAVFLGPCWACSPIRDLVVSPPCTWFWERTNQAHRRPVSELLDESCSGLRERTSAIHRAAVTCHRVTGGTLGGGDGERRAPSRVGLCVCVRVCVTSDPAARRPSPAVCFGALSLRQGWVAPGWQLSSCWDLEDGFRILR